MLYFSIQHQNTYITWEASCKKKLQLSYSNVLKIELIQQVEKNKIICFNVSLFLKCLPSLCLFSLLFPFSLSRQISLSKMLSPSLPMPAQPCTLDIVPLPIFLFALLLSLSLPYHFSLLDGAVAKAQWSVVTWVVGCWWVNGWCDGGGVGCCRPWVMACEFWVLVAHAMVGPVYMVVGQFGMVVVVVVVMVVCCIY